MANKRSLLGVDYYDSDEDEDPPTTPAETKIESTPVDPITVNSFSSSTKTKKIRFASAEMLNTIIQYDPTLPVTQEDGEESLQSKLSSSSSIASSSTFSFIPSHQPVRTQSLAYAEVPGPPPPPKSFSFAKTETVTVKKSLLLDKPIKNMGFVDEKVEGDGLWSSLSRNSRMSPPPKVQSHHHILLFVVF
jgi:hypothetical protein